MTEFQLKHIFCIIKQLSGGETSWSKMIGHCPKRPGAKTSRSKKSRGDTSCVQNFQIQNALVQNLKGQNVHVQNIKGRNVQVQKGRGRIVLDEKCQGVKRPGPKCPGAKRSGPKIHLLKTKVSATKYGCKIFQFH